jgi:outer membrane receptor protein involved in Fe transport
LRRPEEVLLASADITHGPFTARASWRSVGERQDFLYGDDGFGVIGFTGEAPQYDVMRVSLGYGLSPNAMIYLAADNALDELYEAGNGIASAPAAVLIGVRLNASVDRGE